MAITYTNSKVSEEVVGENVRCFQSHIKSAGIRTYDDVLTEVASRLKESKSAARANLDTFGEVVKENLKQGLRCTYDGVCRFELTAEGSFERMDEAWDPAKHKLNVSVIAYDNIKSAIADVVPQNEVKPADVRIIGIQDATTFEQDVYTKGNNLLIQGVGLFLDLGIGDESCGVLKEDGTAIPFTVTNTTNTTIDCTCSAAGLTAGEYMFYVKGRGLNAGDKDYTLVVATRPIIVKVNA